MSYGQGRYNQPVRTSGPVGYSDQRGRGSSMPQFTDILHLGMFVVREAKDVVIDGRLVGNEGKAVKLSLVQREDNKKLFLDVRQQFVGEDGKWKPCKNIGSYKDQPTANMNAKIEMHEDSLARLDDAMAKLFEYFQPKAPNNPEAPYPSNNNAHSVEDPRVGSHDPF